MRSHERHEEEQQHTLPVQRVPGDERQLLPEQSAADHRENEAAAAANFGVHQIWLQLPKQAFKAKGKECGVREPFL